MTPPSEPAPDSLDFFAFSSEEAQNNGRDHLDKNVDYREEQRAQVVHEVACIEADCFE